MADGNGTSNAEPQYPTTEHVLVGGTPGETLGNCAGILRFVGAATDGIEHNGGGEHGDAIFRICDLIADALEWEAKRVQFDRKPEVEVANG